MIKLNQSADHGFDEPLGLLSDCHRRIERFLGAMLAVARQRRGQLLPPDARDVLEQSLRYFETSAPRHTADEEASLFPRLCALDKPEAARAREIIERLSSDHRDVETKHATVDRLARKWIEHGTLSASEGDELLSNLEALDAVYREHIATEDTVLFPAASRLLAEADLEGVGREMADRRGVPFRPPVVFHGRKL